MRLRSTQLCALESMKGKQLLLRMCVNCRSRSQLAGGVRVDVGG